MHTQIKNAFVNLNSQNFQNVNFEISEISENEVNVKTTLIDKPWEDTQVHGDLVTKVTTNAKITFSDNKFTIEGLTTEKVLIEETNPEIIREYEKDGIDLTQPETFKFKNENENLEMLIQNVIFEESYKS